MTGRDNRLSLYVHVPFCDVKCGYCDFNSYAGLDSLMPAYTDALLEEIRRWSPHARGYTVHTVFFGGGTPSLLPPACLERILAAIRDAFTLDAAPEISLEANPGTVDEGRLRHLRALGITRLSLGVQSFHDDELAALDRIHSAADVAAAYAAARAAGFENVNLDLIFGLPGQTLERWEHNVRRALALRPEHLSLYALTVEEGTPLASQVRRGLVPAPDPDLQAEMYERADALLAESGYLQYEISNWSLPGRACRHNLTYWENRPYLGLGPGAHSCFGGRRFSVVRSPRAYVRALTPGGDGMPQIEWEETLDPATEMAETVILGLRLADGVSLPAFQARFGVSLPAVYGDAVRELTDLGLLEAAGGRLRLTRRGRLLANEAFLRFLPDPPAVTPTGTPSAAAP
ncbi:MAG TPA: radical SAM family heme chaperone HemW [Dehalococcoidia bacterium]